MKKAYNGKLLEMTDQLHEFISQIQELKKDDTPDYFASSIKIETKIKCKNVCDLEKAINALYDAISHLDNVLCRQFTDEIRYE